MQGVLWFFSHTNNKDKSRRGWRRPNKRQLNYSADVLHLAALFEAIRHPKTRISIIFRHEIYEKSQQKSFSHKKWPNIEKSMIKCSISLVYRQKQIFQLRALPIETRFCACDIPNAFSNIVQAAPRPAPHFIADLRALIDVTLIAWVKYSITLVRRL